MSEMPTIPEWHERLLQVALQWRDQHPGFTFSLRTGDIKGQNRLTRGYWFTGNDGYLFFPPFAVNDQNNKTKSIGFVVTFDGQQRPQNAYIEVVFGALKDPSLRPVHEQIVWELGSFEKKGSGDKYQRVYPNSDPVTSFSEFLSTEYPRIREIIEKSGRADAFLIPEQEFEDMLQRVEQLRRGRGPAQPARSSHTTQGSTAGPPRNLILYGPPGTGKTYWMKEQFETYSDRAGQLDEVAWLRQVLARSTWRPVIAAALAQLGGTARVPQLRDHVWITAKARERGFDRVSSQVLWNYLQEHTPLQVEIVKTAQRREPFIFTKEEGGLWSLLPDWKDQDPDAAVLYATLSAGPSKAVGEEVLRYRVVTFHPSFGYEDFVRGIRPVIDEETGTTQFRFVDGVFKQICDQARSNPGKRYALFIDEINRANISKVFGELITLIETDKRAVYDDSGTRIGGFAVQLPGGGGTEVAEEPFGVPANLDVYGTMNTADRSIALLDIALRRRFEFREMEPDYTKLERPIGTVDMGRMLGRINDRLEYLLDRDHRIGHAYLMEATTVEDLRRVFRLQIIPLLQEYFFDDFGRVALVLATSAGAPPFLEKERVIYTDLFPGRTDANLPAERSRYQMTDPESWTEATFAGLYADGAGAGAV